jgi:hypothetical protein
MEKNSDAWRCAVSKPNASGYVFFWSPRNSSIAAGVTVDVALRLADRIFSYFS